jgi:hypothetical protein
MKTGTKPIPLADRYWSKVTKGLSENDCWGWIGYKNKNGYVQIGIGSRTDKSKRKVFAHRVSYEIHFGEIPDNMFVCHVCDNPTCSNPKHLFLGSQFDNMADAKSKGRTRKATATHCMNGHLFDGGNTVISSRGTRVCRECMRGYARNHYHKDIEKSRLRFCNVRESQQ